MFNGFGEIFRITTFGESHGQGVGVVIDGCPAGLSLEAKDIDYELARRRPGQSHLSSPRDEEDRCEIISGLFEGQTTGTPIALLIRNNNKRSADYSDIKDKFRPGHADFTYHNKFGIRDYRGGGRSSARETIGRVAAGAVAKKINDKFGIEIYAYVIKVGKVQARNFDKSYIEQNPLRTADRGAFHAMESEITEASESGDSIGAVVELVIKNLPIGLGEPVFDRFNARLAYGIMSMPAVKGIEFGLGFAAAELRGSVMNDEITSKGFLSNNAGGTLGGITTGQDVVLRFALKPISSISIPKRSVDINGNDVEVATLGRHDPCAGARAVPIAEGMAAIVCADMTLINNARKI